MVRNIMGQYRYKDTPIHRLDARIKIICVILLSIFLFSLETMKEMALATGFITLVTVLARISPKQLLRNLRSFVFLFGFILLIYYLFDRQNMIGGYVVVIRFLLLLLISAVLTFSTSASELIYAAEKLLRPFRILRLKPRRIAVMIAITIRFIPMLFKEAQNVRDAQLSRGASWKKPHHIGHWAAALLQKTLMQACRLADALDARNYKDEGHTHFKEYHIKLKDMAAGIVILLLTVLLS